MPPWRVSRGLSFSWSPKGRPGGHPFAHCLHYGLCWLKISMEHSSVPRTEASLPTPDSRLFLPSLHLMMVGSSSWRRWLSQLCSWGEEPRTEMFPPVPVTSSVLAERLLCLSKAQLSPWAPEQPAPSITSPEWGRLPAEEAMWRMRTWAGDLQLLHARALLTGWE